MYSSSSTPDPDGFNALRMHQARVAVQEIFTLDEERVDLLRAGLSQLDAFHHDLPEWISDEVFQAYHALRETLVASLLTVDQYMNLDGCALAEGTVEFYGQPE
jgi:hypothetical protein